jgi:CSLREA domain-containing protein
MLRFAVSLCVALAMLFAAHSVEATVYTVTKTADTNDGVCDVADCSLREAIAAANTGASDDVIAFGAVFSSAQTIVLSLGEMVIIANGTVTINGTGASVLTIDGNNASRILTINNGVAFINGITFTHGNGVGTSNTGRAGAIYNFGATTVISDSVITGNTAANGGGLNNAATPTVPGPSQDGNLTLNRCIVSNNISSSSGGGMQNFSTSTLVINNSTISGNMGGSTTGGGGAQFNGVVRVTNSTFANNTATQGPGGGFQSNGSGQVFTNVTVSGNTSSTNGGGIHRGTTNVNFFIRNSIIAGNNGAAVSPDITNSAGGLDSQGNNIVGNVGTSTGWEATDLVNSNPMLGVLANNGGFGMTFLPLAGSPAINAGQNCVLDLSCSANNPPQAVTTDQRGITRPQGPTVDIGAVEVAAVQANATITGRVLTSSGQGVFRSAVTISGPGGVNQTTLTNNFGYFTFTGIPTGQTYTLNVSSKLHTFAPQQVVVNGDVTDITIMPSSVSPADEKSRDTQVSPGSEF